MNKRFSTLLATALVAGGLSANAQNAITGSVIADKIYTSPARNYMLQTSTFSSGSIAQVISVDDAAENAKVVTADAANVNAQLWTIKVTTVSGSNRFVLVNKANGTTLSFDAKSAIAADASGNVAAPAVGSKAFSLVEASNDTEWTWYSAPNATSELASSKAIVNAFRADSSMAVAVQAGTGLLYAYKYANSDPATLTSGDVQLGLQAVIPGSVAMTAEDLNVLGEGDNKYFTLSTNKTGLVEGDQLIGRKFHAEKRL